VTVWPGLTSTAVSVPPVVKFTPASLGEYRDPVPLAVASTMPWATV